MPDNIWCILEAAEVLMRSFALIYGPEQYNWMLPDVHEGATEEEVARAPQMPRPKMLNKLDGPVMLIHVIPMGRFIHQQPRKTT